MSKAFIMIGIVALTHLSRTSSFRFSISRSLSSTKALETNWCHVEVIQTEISDNDVIKVKVEIPSTLPYSDIFIFFANETKEILQVSLNKLIKGKFYAAPYKLIKEEKGEETTVNENGHFYEVSGGFPSSWLPVNCSKISATVTGRDGIYYNYYGIQNFKISLPDLMVVEEFKNFI